MRCLLNIVMSWALVGVIAGCSSQENELPEVGTRAPSFQLQRVNGEELFRSDSLEGEVVVLCFWSTTCANCIREIDELNSIHASGKAKVIGIALDRDVERVRKMVEQKNIDYEVLMGDQETFARYDGFSIPYTVVLDETQTICKKFHGRMTEEQFDEAIKVIHGSKQVAMRKE